MLNHTRFMDIANIISKGSTCQKHQVGAVIVRDNRIISHGYNGVPSGSIHCCDIDHGDNHHQWSLENEIHAEANALIWAGRSGISCVNAIMYCTLSPCYDCTKLIIASGISLLVYRDEYRHANQDWMNKFKDARINVLRLIPKGERYEYQPIVSVCRPV